MFEPNKPYFLAESPCGTDAMWLRRQRTLGSPVQTRGVGFFTGCDVRMTLHPAEAGHGITFERTDLPAAGGGRPVPATIDHLARLPRRTGLTLSQLGGSDDAQPAVQMIEHTMAALAGLSLDNVRIELDGPECPGFDGSSEELTGRLLDAGVLEQDVPRAAIEIAHTLEVTSGDASIRIEPSRSGHLEIEYHLDYPHDQVGQQAYAVEMSPRVFAYQLADARTFILEEEVQPLRSMGIGLRHTPRDLVVFGENGPIDNQLRHSDEPVRHKLLDCVGDFALAGCELRGRFICHRSGHALNHAAVREVLASHAVVQASRPVLRAA